MQMEQAAHVAGVVISDGRGLGMGDGLPTRLPRQKFAEFIRFGCQGQCPRLPGGIVRQQARIFQAHHGGAGAAGEDDGFVRLKNGDGALGQPPRFLAQAAVEEGLPAAGLRLGKVYGAAGAPQQARGGHAYFGHDLVYEAGDAEGDGCVTIHGCWRAGGTRAARATRPRKRGRRSQIPPKPGVGVGLCAWETSYLKLLAFVRMIAYLGAKRAASLRKQRGGCEKERKDEG